MDRDIGHVNYLHPYIRTMLKALHSFRLPFLNRANILVQFRLLHELYLFLVRLELGVVMHVLVMSRLGYCSALYVGAEQNMLTRHSCSGRHFCSSCNLQALVLQEKTARYLAKLCGSWHNELEQKGDLVNSTFC